MSDGLGGCDEGHGAGSDNYHEWSAGRQASLNKTRGYSDPAVQAWLDSHPRPEGDEFMTKFLGLTPVVYDEIDISVDYS